MANYIKALNQVNVFDYPTEGAHIIKKLQAGDLIEYNREKRREGINWMEVYLDNGDRAYIRNEMRTIFLCKYCYLGDDEVSGFNYKLKDDQLSIRDVFRALTVDEIKGGVRDKNKSYVEVKRWINREKNKVEYMMLEYDPALAEVKQFTLEKNDLFYITENDSVKSVFLEVNDMFEKKGMILHSASFTLVKDKWMIVVGMIITILTIVGIILGFYLNGWIVIGTILIIPGFIAAFIILFFLKIILSILGGLFNQVRKRF